MIDAFSDEWDDFVACADLLGTASEGYRAACHDIASADGSTVPTLFAINRAVRDRITETAATAPVILLAVMLEAVDQTDTWVVYVDALVALRRLVGFGLVNALDSAVGTMMLATTAAGLADYRDALKVL